MYTRSVNPFIYLGFNVTFNTVVEISTYSWSRFCTVTAGHWQESIIFPTEGPGFELPSSDVGGKCVTTTPMWSIYKFIEATKNVHIFSADNMQAENQNTRVVMVTGHGSRLSKQSNMLFDAFPRRTKFKWFRWLLYLCLQRICISETFGVEVEIYAYLLTDPQDLDCCVLMDLFALPACTPTKKKQ